MCRRRWTRAGRGEEHSGRAGRGEEHQPQHVQPAGTMHQHRWTDHRRTTVPKDKPLGQSHEPGAGHTPGSGWTGRPCSWGSWLCARDQLSSSRPAPAEASCLQPWGPGTLRRCCTDEVRTLPWVSRPGRDRAKFKASLTGPQSPDAGLPHLGLVWRDGRGAL